MTTSWSMPGALQLPCRTDSPFVISQIQGRFWVLTGFPFQLSSVLSLSPFIYLFLGEHRRDSCHSLNNHTKLGLNSQSAVPLHDSELTDLKEKKSHPLQTVEKLTRELTGPI